MTEDTAAPCAALLVNTHIFTYFEIIGVDVGQQEIVLILRLQDHSAVCVWRWTARDYHETGRNLQGKH